MMIAIISYILLIVMLIKNNKKQDEIWKLDLKLVNIKNTLYSKNKKKVTILKSEFE